MIKASKIAFLISLSILFSVVSVGMICDFFEKIAAERYYREKFKDYYYLSYTPQTSEKSFENYKSLMKLLESSAEKEGFSDRKIDLIKKESEILAVERLSLEDKKIDPFRIYRISGDYRLLLDQDFIPVEIIE